MHRYILVDSNGVETVFEYRRLAEAKRIARALGNAIVKRTYTLDEDGDPTLDDSALVWTPDGADTRPPKAA